MSVDSDKILLILDLDETLIHATKEDYSFKPDFEIFGYKASRRPYLKEFLENSAQVFKLAIWSSASDVYVQEVVKRIKPAFVKFEFVWGRSKATYAPTVDLNETGYLDPEHYHYIKRLKKIKPMGFRLEKTLIVDDTPHKSKENYGNAIYIREFHGDPDDQELKMLEKYLLEFKDCIDVRKIEKRGWRERYL